MQNLNQKIRESIRGRPHKRDKKDNKNRGYSRSKSKNTTYKCFTCHKEGYFRRDCLERKKNQSERPKETGDVVVIMDGYNFTEVLTISDTGVKKDLILDSGCLFHMCPSKTWFETLEKSGHGIVLLRNNKGCKVIGTSTVRIRMFDSMERILEKVRYIPDLKRNLISLGMLDQIGCSFKAENGCLKVVKGSMVIIKGVKMNELYILDGRTVIGNVSNVQK